MYPPAYERDPRETRLHTRVVGTRTLDGRPWVVLDDTILYPEGGGQPADLGHIGERAVLDVQRVDDDIVHLVDGAPPTGEVLVTLDWERRFDHMQQHTAQHLLTAVAERDHGWPTTAFHLGARVSDIELGVPGISEDSLTALEEAVAAEIRGNRPVTARHVSPEEFSALDVRSRGLPHGHSGPVRLVEIEGLDSNTCGGTHCSSTGELETLQLLATESMRGGTKVVWAAGRRVRRLLREHHARSGQLRTLLGAADEEVVSAVESRSAQIRELTRTNRYLQQALAEESAVRLAAGGEALASHHWDERDASFLKTVASAFVELRPDAVIVLTAGATEDGAFLVGVGPEAGVDVRAVGQLVCDALRGRGGGAGLLFQGKATRLSARSEAVEAVAAAIEASRT